MTEPTCPNCNEPMEEWFLEEGKFICSNTECDNENLYNENGEEIRE